MPQSRRPRATRIEAAQASMFNRCSISSVALPIQASHPQTGLFGPFEHRPVFPVHPQVVGDGAAPNSVWGFGAPNALTRTSVGSLARKRREFFGHGIDAPQRYESAESDWICKASNAANQCCLPPRSELVHMRFLSRYLDRRKSGRGTGAPSASSFCTMSRS